MADRIRLTRSVRGHLRALGIQVGQLIDYACPDLPGYEPVRGTAPQATGLAQRMINLPNWPGLGLSRLDAIVDALCRVRDYRSLVFTSASDWAQA